MTEAARGKDGGSVDKRPPAEQAAPHWRRIELLSGELTGLVGKMVREFESLEALNVIAKNGAESTPASIYPAIFGMHPGKNPQDPDSNHAAVCSAARHAIDAIFSMHPTEARGQLAAGMWQRHRGESAIAEMFRGYMMASMRQYGEPKPDSTPEQKLAWRRSWTLPGMAMRLAAIVDTMQADSIPPMIGCPPFSGDPETRRKDIDDDCDVFTRCMTESETLRKISEKYEVDLLQHVERVAALDRCECRDGLRCSFCEAKEYFEATGEAGLLQWAAELGALAARLTEYAVDLMTAGLRCPLFVEGQAAMVPVDFFQPQMDEAEFAWRLRGRLDGTPTRGGHRYEPETGGSDGQK